MERVIFWGATGQAKVLRECVAHDDMRLVAVVDNDPEVPPPFSDVPILRGVAGFEEWLAKTDHTLPLGFLVAIGGPNGEARLNRHDYLAAKGLVPRTARHPRAFVAPNVEVGDGAQILAHATVCVGVVLGRQCIINHSANVDHECRLGDGAHICPGAKLAGLVDVGRCAMIGTGAVILPRLKIGVGAIVGAGAVVTKDVPPGVIVAGNPARILTPRAPVCESGN